MTIVEVYHKVHMDIFSSVFGTTLPAAFQTPPNSSFKPHNSDEERVAAKLNKMTGETFEPVSESVIKTLKNGTLRKLAEKHGLVVTCYKERDALVEAVCAVVQKPLRLRARLAVRGHDCANCSDEQILDIAEERIDKSCVICLCDYECDDKLRLLPCGHAFHVDCAQRWMSEHLQTTRLALEYPSCPKCRCRIDMPDAAVQKAIGSMKKRRRDERGDLSSDSDE